VGERDGLSYSGHFVLNAGREVRNRIGVGGAQLSHPVDCSKSIELDEIFSDVLSR